MGHGVEIEVRVGHDQAGRLAGFRSQLPPFLDLLQGLDEAAEAM
jgi:hypothetical protein